MKGTRRTRYFRFLRLKRGADGLNVILSVALLCLIIQFAPFFLHRPAPQTSLPFLLLLLWGVCFWCVRMEQLGKIQVPFFEKFDGVKGILLMLIWPSLGFLYALFTDPRHALETLHPFNHLLHMHLVLVTSLAVLLPIFAVASWLERAFKRKRRSSKIRQTIPDWIKESVRNCLYLKSLFVRAENDPIAKSVTYLVVGSYFIFSCLCAFAWFTPAATVPMYGTVISAARIDYVMGKRSHLHYCLIDLRANLSLEDTQFELRDCGPCTQPGTLATVHHHIFDYLSTRANSIECNAVGKATTMPPFDII